MSYADECTRLYMRLGRVAHLRNTFAPGVLCDATPPSHEEWLGTGSQAEYEKAAGLPLCRKCAFRAYAEDAQP
jgi:hypothetical protein